MQYEHLIEVNDPNNPMLTQLTRQQLWRGLIHRIEAPGEFLPGVEAVTLVSRSDVHIERVMQLGALGVHDRIDLEHEQRLHYHTRAGSNHLGGELVVTIEEPDEGHLFVRFRYDTPVADLPEDGVDYVGYLKAAYRKMDAEAIGLIRELAATDRLDGPAA
ncbi:DUF1857 domain-containing protein [Microvirgula aerodenitrificans]|uniref:DUF1857 domain-containing protein n=1 Tax=Microvirgula aerodenitrificans TaxID=57480 RepID=A0A2S0PBR3_9NEIS|nr:AtaL-like protein [Microvirgula aerodenitrificans]AVY94830.1 DUF1857 domain-containing protein [Microvirgula aerodenitrificans]